MKFYTNIDIIGSTVFVREVIDGIPNMRKDHWEPTVYVKGKPREYVGESFKTLHGDTVYPIKPGSISETKKFVEKYEDVQGFDIFGQLNYVLQYCGEYDVVGFDRSFLSVWAIDIETRIPVRDDGKTYFPKPETVPAEILLISMTNMFTGVTYTFGQNDVSEKVDSRYMRCDTEVTLIKQWLQWMQQFKPNAITGWNINGFDLPYLYNRITKILGEEHTNQMSPWHKVSMRSKEIDGRMTYNVNITGVEVLDYLELYQKYILTPRESYKLDFIAQEELNERKLDYSQYGSMKEFYENDWTTFVKYNIHDNILVKRLNDKLNLLDIVFTVAYKAKVPYESTFSPVATWDAIISNYAYAKGIVLPQQEREKVLPLDGAYVKEPVPGFYKNVGSVDATSLYPSCIMTNNISPDTWLGNCGLTIDEFLDGKVTPDENNVITPVGAVYSKEKVGILPELVKIYMADRKKAKGEMLRIEQEIENCKSNNKPYDELDNQHAAYDALQNAIKVLMNSLYGATANKWFRFFKHDHAASITLTGQYVLRSIENTIDDKLNALFGTSNVKYLIYIDTDSLYFTLEAPLDKFGIPESKRIAAVEKLMKEKVTPIVNQICESCCETMNSYENKLSFKLEVAADKAIWTGKKKYAVRVYSSEGVSFAKPKMKIKGLEMVRSSTPAFVRQKLNGALDLVFNSDEKTVQKFIADVKEEFFKLDINEIAFPRGVNGLKEYVHRDAIYRRDTSVPINTRAALLYNHHLKHLGIDGKYKSIEEGDKIKFVYLKKPNKLKENVIGWPVDDRLPTEFGVANTVDYELQFEKTFLASMQIILGAIKWNTIEQSSLEDFFV